MHYITLHYSWLRRDWTLILSNHKNHIQNFCLNNLFMNVLAKHKKNTISHNFSVLFQCQKYSTHFITDIRMQHKYQFYQFNLIRELPSVDWKSNVLSYKNKLLRCVLFFFGWGIKRGEEVTFSEFISHIMNSLTWTC